MTNKQDVACVAKNRNENVPSLRQGIRSPTSEQDLLWKELQAESIQFSESKQEAACGEALLPEGERQLLVLWEYGQLRESPCALRR